MVISYLLGIMGIFFLFLFIRNSHVHLSQFKNYGQIFKGALVGGFGISFLLTILITTITPTVVTIESGHVHKEGLSFYGNEGFLGIGGCYVANNSNNIIQVIGIEEDKDINVTINPQSTQKIRKCPEEYFGRTPTNETRGSYRVTKSRKGRRKIISGNTVFLYDYKPNE